MRPARFAEVRKFCQVDGWTCAAAREGRSTSRHEVWTKPLADGTVLRTVISKGRGEYSGRMTAWIIKHELRVTEQEFWDAVRRGRVPERPAAPPARPSGELLPLGLTRALLAAGHTIDDVRGLTIDEAKRLLKPR